MMAQTFLDGFCDNEQRHGELFVTILSQKSLGKRILLEQLFVCTDCRSGRLLYMVDHCGHLGARQVTKSYGGWIFWLGVIAL